MTKNWKLSPSDFAFLWEECRRCFYLKVVRGFARPSAPMPKVFNRIDSIMKHYFSGKRSVEIAAALPPGVVEFGEKWVESRAIAIPNHTSTCFIRGKFDTVIRFEDGSYGVVDFKTSEINSTLVPLYSRQLRAYAYALENSAPGNLRLAPISRLGLLCVDPVQMFTLEDGRSAYAAKVAWIECPRDDEAFMEFIGEVLDVLEQSEPPGRGATCPWCQYRDMARHIPL